MKKQATIFDYVGQAFLLFGVIVVLLMLISQVFGSDVKEYSIMFSLGNEGLTTDLLLQFLSISIIITGLNVIFASDKFIKTGSKALRISGLLGSIILIMSLYIYFFHWFPMNSITPWLLFFLMFFSSFGISVAVVLWKERLENRQMEEALKRVKAQLEEDLNVKDH